MNLLPEDMIYEIGTFLSRKDFRSLLSTSNKMKYSKYKYQYLNLNKKNPDYLHQIIKKVSRYVIKYY